MKNFNELSKGEQNTILGTILEAYKGLTLNNLKILIKLTEVNGCSFVNIKDYCSEKSGNTEVADALINVGASYANMLAKDVVKFETLDLNEIDVNKFDYRKLNVGEPFDFEAETQSEEYKTALESFKTAVVAALPVALMELQGAKKTIDTSADIALNKVLFFNMNTLNLAIKGQIVNKSVKVEGSFKIVKSAPKTIAKQLINNFVNSRAASLRRYNLSNIITRINVNGIQLDIN